MQHPGNSGSTTTTALVPEVQILHGVPTIVNASDNHLEVDGATSGTPLTAPSWSNLYKVLHDPSVMRLIPGTYDTYKCNDCNIVLSGYKRGDPDVNDHVRHGGGQCRYIKMRYKGHEKELLILQGKFRFQRGCLAFPEYILHSCYGYVTIAGTKHCVVCSGTFWEHMPHNPCVNMGTLLSLKHLKLDVPIDDTPLFTRGLGRVHLDDIQPDSAVAQFDTHFSVLGEPANMYHLPHTVDTHKCYACHLTVQNFVQNDTLLGEHTYHVDNTGLRCPYIEKRFMNRQHELKVMIGKERYRKGFIAFPGNLTHAAYGYVSILGQKRCVVCSAMTNQMHQAHCDAMKKSLLMKLKDMSVLI